MNGEKRPRNSDRPYGLGSRHGSFGYYSRKYVEMALGTYDDGGKAEPNVPVHYLVFN